MKIPSPLQRQRRSGVAIVLVLSILVLLTVLVVGFFTNATTDLTSSKSYSDSVRVKLLGDSAVNLMQSQIRLATSGLDGGKVVAWASQPGVIRTYDENGDPKKTYKLFSSDKLTVDGAYNPVDTAQATLDIPIDWNTHPSDFTDLNSPLVVEDPNGSITGPDPTDPTKTTNYSARFPIIDGTNLVNLNGTLTYDGILPGLPPGGSGDSLPDIEGFAVQKPATYDSAKLIGPNNNPVPMPVRWLYVLQNGQLQARDPQTGIIPGATNDKANPNPVVGRIAFWTDDDTCKLNINTASEGTPWDRPYAKTATEVAYSTNMPVQNEFQAFTGHPSKTSLSTVLGGLWPVPSYTITGTTSVAASVLKVGTAISPGGNYQQLLPYYDLVPRVTESKTKGSAGAAQSTLVVDNAGSSAAGTRYGIPYDADRLYTSVDELMFKQQMANDNLTRLARNNTANTGAGNALTPQLLETARFFLTTNNRAPEVTMLNTPRIALWPLQYSPNNKDNRTTKEQLLAFCSTIPAAAPGNLYAIQRYSTSTSPTNGSSNSATEDWTSVLRNRQIYGYLKNLMDSPVPGLGGKFSAKYPTNVDQIETEMVDQIRSTTNLYTYRDAPEVGYTYTNAGQVLPLVNPSGTNSQGFGRFSTITEAAVDFFQCYDSQNKDARVQIGAVLILQPFNASPGYGSMQRNMQIEVIGLDQFTIQDSDPAKAVKVSLGFPTPSANVSAVNVVDVPDGQVANGNLTEYNGLISSFYRLPRQGENGPQPKTLSYGTNAGDTNYPFFNTPDPGFALGGAATLNKGTTQFDFNPDGNKTITINIYPNPRLPNQAPLQTITMTFPPCPGLPVPKLSTNAIGQPSGGNTVDTFKQRIVVGSSDGQITDPMNGEGNGRMARLIDGNDVVRSMVVAPNGAIKGDFRLVAGSHNVPPEYFAPHPFYFYRDRGGLADPLFDPNAAAVDKNWQFAHNLRAGDNPGWGSIGWYDYGAMDQSKYLTPDYPQARPRSSITRKSAYSGTLVEGLTYTPESFPTVAPGTKGAFLLDRSNTPQPGDWDSGVGNLEDGPYIGKPDEGNSVFANLTGNAKGTNATSIYFSRSRAGNEGGATYSPNREISSAVIFGSLPTGIKPADPLNARPWQTLLFCANPAAGIKHPGFGISVVPSDPLVPPNPPYRTIPDFFLMDLFTMPIVEPYAISEPLSSQGKVNMNYQIAPFTYITRNTAVRAVMKSTRLMAIPSSPHALANYKASQYGKAAGDLTSGYDYRYNINPDENSGTLKAFKDRFDKGDIFRSAAEICNIPLVPSRDPSKKYDPAASPAIVTPDAASLKSFWDNCKLTGDNVREQPYGDLYPRLTTKSNTFTVHIRVQTLKKALGTSGTTFIDPTEKSPGIKDIITAEYRGSYQIERYVDPNIPTAAVDPVNGFPDYAVKYDPSTPANYKEISAFYKFHTIASKEF